MTERGLLDKARNLLPALEERAAETEALRRIPDETIKELQSAGLFRALQPARFGGLEADPLDFYEAILAIGAVCGSTAWVLSVVGVHSWQMGLFDLRAQEEVWGDDDTALISSSYAPTGSVQRVDGGFILNGRWHFSSGVDHCKWAFLGGVAPRDPGTPPPPDMRTFLIPESDFRVEDNWHVAGLSGSGSKDVVVEDAFVPEHRTHGFIDVLAIDSPGNAVNTSPLFRLPFGGLFSYTVAIPALGISRGALARYTEQCRTRMLVDRSKMSDDPFSQLRLAEATALIDGAYHQFQANIRQMQAYAAAGEKPTLIQRARWRFDASRTTRIATEAMDLVFEASGGRAIYSSNPLQRGFRDVHAMRGHANNNSDRAAQIYTQLVLGFPNKEFLL